jgi:hypothetical protein
VSVLALAVAGSICTRRIRRLAARIAVGAVLVLGSGPRARAAAGSIDFKELKVGLSHAHHRPMPPIIVVQRRNGEWKPSPQPVQFELSISAKVDTLSSIYRLLVGVPSVEKNNFTAWTAGYNEGSAKVEVRSTTFSFPGNALVLSPVSTGDLCAQSAAGRGNDFLVSFRLPIEVRVAATRGITNVEERFKTYNREIDAAVRCVVLAETEAAHPQRTPVKPQRTAVEPQRTAVAPQRTAVAPQRTPVVPQRTPVDLRPDLVVRDVRVVEGETSRLEAEVANVGKGDAAASQVTLTYRRSGHVLEREAAVRPLKGGESIWVTLEAPGAIAPGVGVVLHVDGADRIAETDERNNSRVFQ